MILGDDVTAERGLIIEAFSEYAGETFSPKIVIGDRVSFGYNCHIGCINRVTIGNDVLIASRVFISDHSHGTGHASELGTTPVRRRLHSKGGVTIGSRVWVGEGVCILAGVSVGDNAIIGANSVVTRDVPANSVVAGAPARLLRMMNAHAPEAS
jgi:acetyltransferase-like isoleucine patch superfamily enzyme